jgi:hypothetical protein
VPHGFGQAQPTSRVTMPANGLSLEIGSAGFSYVLTPIDIRRGPSGLRIGVLEHGFDDSEETYAIETALISAQAKISQFAARLSQDATMLVRIARDYEAQNTPPEETHEAHREEVSVSLAANDQLPEQTNDVDVA